MRIYVDFDDVVTETARLLCDLAHEMFGRNVAYDDVFAFDLRKSLFLSDDEVGTLMSRAHSDEILAAYEETPGATETLAAWMALGHEITVVTGRPSLTHAGTCRWLEARGLGAIPVVHVDKFGRELAAQFHSKEYVVSLEDFYKMRFDFAVEDSPLALGHLARLDGCRTAVFGRPWNRNEALPAGDFRRCANWREVDAYLRQTSKLPNFQTSTTTPHPWTTT